MVNADPVQIGQLVMNLVSNAQDATGDDGTVVVSLAQDFVEPGNIVVCSHGDLKSGGYAVVSVQDDGVGMSERVASRIFDPFFTTKSDGHGLGLAGVIATVKGHGGVIDVRSARGVGTTIRVYLPMQGPPVSAQLPVGEDARSAETPIASTPSEDEQDARSISQA